MKKIEQTRVIDAVRINTAARHVGKNHAILRRAMAAGTLRTVKTADGLDLVTLAEADRWAKQATRGRPKKTTD